MPGSLLSLLSSGPTVAGALLSDAFSLATRPLVPLSFLLHGEWPTINAFTSGGLFYGCLGTVSTVLTGCSLGVLLQSVGGNPMTLLRPAAAVYLLDGTCQLAKMWFPAITYPASRTGLVTLGLQLPLASMSLLPTAAAKFADALGVGCWYLLAGATSLRYMSFNLATTPAVSSLFWSGSLVLALFGFTPSTVWKMIFRVVQKVSGVLASVASSVYACVTYVIPKVIAVVKSILEHPCCVFFYTYVVLPLWKLFSPLFLPTCTAAISFSCLRSLLLRTSSPLIAPGGNLSAVLRFGQSLGAAAAALSTGILLMNLVLHIRRRSQPDPLRHQVVLKILSYPSALVAVPVRFLRWAFERCVDQVLWPLLRLLMSGLWRLGQFAVKSPLLSIPSVLLVNVLLVRSMSSSSGALARCAQLLGFSTSWVSQLLHRFAELRHGATDSTLAVLLITLVQAAAYAMVDGVLSVLRNLPLLDASGAALGYEELNEVAAAMVDPRQCARCGFGPIDHQGCDNLRTHHGEVMAGGVIQNQCLRCGWFANSLTDWPPWDGELHTEQGRAMQRQRTWCEVVVTIKASSKALVVPYSMLLLGEWLQLSPTLAGSLAFSYLIPWTIENSSLFASLASPVVPPRRRAPRRGQAPRGQRPAQRADDADCGAQRSDPELPDITQSVALQTILTSLPDAIYLKPGAICSVCLETFPDEAAEVVGKEGAASAAGALQRLRPPVVALRCGHPLHLECAEAAVSASRSRHLRCPLCRQPVTLTGEATANVFS